MNMASPSPASPESPASPRSISDLLTCPVCLDTFRDPKTLSCLHTFCSFCLENCRRPYHREIVCPVCKKTTTLNVNGVQGLQNDFRIQQIRDLLQQRSPSPPMSDEEPGSPAGNLRSCDLCKSQHRMSVAGNHCIQCYMYFCTECVEKHGKNPLFASHQVVDLLKEDHVESLFCRTHVEYTVRYFCKTCNSMLCTICTMTHDPEHAPVSLDHHIIEKYQNDLQQSLKQVKTRLSEVNSRAKYTEMVRQTYQKALFEAQNSIKQRTRDLMEQIKQQEQNLLKETQSRMEGRIKSIGLGGLGEINFHKRNLEGLLVDIQSAIQGPPQQYFLTYEELLNRTKAVTDSPMPNMPSTQANTVVKFTPSEDTFQIVLGHLKDVSIKDEGDTDKDPSAYEVIDLEQSPNWPSGRKKTVPKRVTSILSALSPGRKGDMKIGKVKAISHADKAKSGKAINADALIDEELGSGDPQPSTSSSNPDSPNLVNMEAAEQRTYLDKPVLLFKVDQVGGWPGKIMNPCAIDLLPDGSVVVAEGDNRLQVFDRQGQSVRIIAWGKIKPQGIAITKQGHIAITDKKDKCVKIFSVDGYQKACWGAGTFGLPAGIAITSTGNFVVTDVDRHAVSIHSPDGTLLSQFGAWGNGNYQFNCPAYVAIGQDDRIYVSDTCNCCIKVFDSSGKFQTKIQCGGSSVSHAKRPQGICLDQQGNVLMADRDNHRISIYSLDGNLQRHVVTRHDGIKYPCDIKMDSNGTLVLVETHSGFLSKEPHHAVKMYSVLN